jgi:hypothetical protein
MAFMSIAEAWPAAGRPFTVADLDRMPDDGHRYELLDGALVVPLLSTSAVRRPPTSGSAYPRSGS